MFTVTLTRADGHRFNNAFSTIREARVFLANASSVLLPGESLTLKAFA